MDDEGRQYSAQSSGPSTDRHNEPVVDPTRNVLDLVDAAVARINDLRAADKANQAEVERIRALFLANERTHIREIADLRGKFDDKLREAEANRIDAIRAVDVGAVAAAAQVQATQATTLAAQVATSAETLRNQVAAAATAQTVALAAALEPIIKDIADLRRAQYEAQGVKASVVERRESSGAVVAAIAVGVSILVALVVIAAFVIANTGGPPA